MFDEARAELMLQIRKGIRDGSWIRLHPKKPIYLECPDRDGARFARIFRDVWRRLPLRVRRSVLRLWGSPRNTFQVLNPTIGLADWWEDRATGRGLRGDKAWVSRGGHRQLFWSKVVHAYPDNLVADLIAHELAHVYQYSLGMEKFRIDGRSVTRWGDREMDQFVVEEDADSYVLNWGFGVDAIDQWDRSHGVTGTIDLDRMSKSSVRRLLKKRERAGR